MRGKLLTRNLRVNKWRGHEREHGLGLRGTSQMGRFWLTYKEAKHGIVAVFNWSRLDYSHVIYCGEDSE